MANDSMKRAYVPFWKAKDIDPDVLTKTTRVLVKSLEELNTLLNSTYKDKKYMAFDIETTGLNPISNDAEIIGYSFAFDGSKGYYVAVDHAEGGELNLGTTAVDLIYNKMLTIEKTFVANLQFDFVYMEFEGDRRGKVWDMSKVKYYDIFVGLYLADSNIKFLSLKKSAKFWLGWDLDTFEATLGDAYNFKYVHPNDAYTYGCFDAIMTYALAPISLNFYKESKLSGKIDNEFLYPLSQMLKDTVLHDLKYVKELYTENTERVKFLETEIYRLVGAPFNIGSPKQLSDALLSIGFDTGVRTKSGYMKAGMDELEAQNRKTPHSIVALLIEFKKREKSLSTYIKPILKMCEDRNTDRHRYCYHLYSAPTCRLSGGKDGKNDYYAPINMHAITKPKSKNWYVHPYKEGDTINDGDRVILDWRYSLVEPSDYITEGLDPVNNLRNIFLPNDNSYWVSIDFSAEELRLIANYSKSKVWCSAFLNGEDLHKNMAIEMWGKDNYNHDLRNKAKGLNFGGVTYTPVA